MTRIIRGKPSAFDYNDSRTIELNCFPQQATPIVARKLLELTYRSAWLPGEHGDGRDMIVRVIVSIYQGCYNETAEAVRDVYRLLDHSINGRLYTLHGGDGTDMPEQVLPIIPRVPGDFNGAYGESVIAQMKMTQGVIRNGDDGTAYGPYPEATGKRQLLEAIRNLLQNQMEEPTLDDEMLAQLVLIAGRLA